MNNESRFLDVTEEVRKTVEKLAAWIRSEARAMSTVDTPARRGPRIRLHGRRTPDQIRADFWLRVGVGDIDQCWEWKAGLNGKGKDSYGVFWANGKKLKAHYFAACQIYGEKPQGLLVCHRCDNPKCCNPLHLYFGTHKDNTRDCIAAGRFVRDSGESRYNAKLTTEQVEEIKRDAVNRRYGWGVATAKKYGVSQTAINNIIMGRRWRGASGPQRVGSGFKSKGQHWDNNIAKDAR